MRQSEKRKSKQTQRGLTPFFSSHKARHPTVSFSTRLSTTCAKARLRLWVYWAACQLRSSVSLSACT